jgi:hypothetical protein
MTLVDDVKSWWKWLSTWLLAMNGTFIVAYEQFDTVKAYIPDKWAHTIVGTLLILTFLGRIIKQNVPAQ